MPIGYSINKEEYNPTNPNHLCGSSNNDENINWWMELRHIGKVVSISERNEYHDSDFYATYLDDESKTFKSVMYATTRAWTYNLQGATKVDATPEIIQKYNDFEAFSVHVDRISDARWQELVQSRTIKTGSVVKVYKGRKVSPGTTGTVFWVGNDTYSGLSRLGIKDESGNKHFVAGAHCKLIMENGEEVLSINDSVIPQRYDGIYSKQARLQEALGVRYCDIRSDVVKELEVTA